MSQRVDPDWRRPWQRELEVQRRAERIKAGIGEGTDHGRVSQQQHRRFQRTEMIKTLAVVLGAVLLLAALGLFFTYVVPLK